MPVCTALHSQGPQSYKTSVYLARLSLSLARTHKHKHKHTHTKHFTVSKQQSLAYEDLNPKGWQGADKNRDATMATPYTTLTVAFCGGRKSEWLQVRIVTSITEEASRLQRLSLYVLSNCFLYSIKVTGLVPSAYSYVIPWTFPVSYKYKLNSFMFLQCFLLYLYLCLCVSI